MAVILRLRGPDGKFVKGSVKHLETDVIRFGSTVIQDGRQILTEPGADGWNKRTQSDTLYNDYHYTMKSGSSTISLGFEFGRAKDYWQFVDQGVQGVGGVKKGKTKKGEEGKRGGTGMARGMGSPFRFKYASPGGLFFHAIKGWIANKPVSLGEMTQESLAWAIGYSVKRRGLSRTLFYSKPVEKRLRSLPSELVEAFRLDVQTLIGKLPSKMTVTSTKLEI